MGDPKTRIITLVELEKHSTKEDAWMALRGKVFNVTSYIKQHPGGVTPIAKAIGKDGTEFFDSVHAYVRFDDVLAGQQVGVLERGSLTQEKKKALKARSKKKKRPKPKGLCGCCGAGHVEGYPDLETYESSHAIVYVVTFMESEFNSSESDWTIGIGDQRILVIRKVIGHADIWQAYLRLMEKLTDDSLHIHFDHNFNTMELTFHKPTPGNMWKHIGNPAGEDNEHNQIVDSRSTRNDFEACIVHKQQLTEDIYLFAMQLKPSVRYGIPIGYHVHIRIGNDTRRNYTPVCHSMLKEDQEQQFGDGQVIWFIIKIYPKGQLTSVLDRIPVEDPETSRFPISLGCPAGNFGTDLLISGHGHHGIATLNDTKVMMLFAGGTGITPFTRIIRWYLEELIPTPGSITHVVLMFWNKTEDDIIWKNQWLELAAREPRFHYFPVLTTTNGSPTLPTDNQVLESTTRVSVSAKPSTRKSLATQRASRKSIKGWNGYRGHVSTDLIQKSLDSLPGEVSSSDKKQAMICGPVGFNSAVEEALNGIISFGNIHIFAG